MALKFSSVAIGADVAVLPITTDSVVVELQPHFPAGLLHLRPALIGLHHLTVTHWERDATLHALCHLLVTRCIHSFHVASGQSEECLYSAQPYLLWVGPPAAI